MEKHIVPADYSPLFLKEKSPVAFCLSVCREP